jgi:1-acyl-sn-glycerol-3-phosphate acyltransferase
MVTGRDLLAGCLLFWPFFLAIVLVGFFSLVGLVFFIGSTILLFGIFLYGLYSVLQDTGALDWILHHVSTVVTKTTQGLQDHLQKSFVFEQVKPTNISQPSLFLCHPHGLYGITWFLHFSGKCTKWPLSSRPVLAVHSVFFKLPIIRELIKKHSCIEATEEQIRKTLEGGASVAVLVGGIEELMLTQSDTMKVILKKREGYARIAHSLGVPIIQLVSVGENKLFPSLESPLWSSFQRKLYTWFRISLPLPTVSSLYSWIQIAQKPLENPLKTYILEPITDTSQKSIQDIRDEAVKRLQTFAKMYHTPLDIVA